MYTGDSYIRTLSSTKYPDVMSHDGAFHQGLQCLIRQKQTSETEMQLASGCSPLTVLLMYCDNQCSVALPHGAMGWPAVCDCGII